MTLNNNSDSDLKAAITVWISRNSKFYLFTSSLNSLLLKMEVSIKGIWYYRTGYVVTNIQIGKFDISINPRSTDGKPIEKVVVTIPMSKSTTTVNATCNVGQYMFDPVTKVWEANVYTPRLIWCVPNRSFRYSLSNGRSPKCKFAIEHQCCRELTAAGKIQYTEEDRHI
jgi:hypothetical protein